MFVLRDYRDYLLWHNSFSSCLIQPVRFRPKTRHLKFTWIWAHRPSIKGSKLLFPVIKAIKIKTWLHEVDIVFRQICASRCCFYCSVTIDLLALCVSPIYVYICVYRYMYTQMCVYVCIWAYIYICICIQNMVVYMCPFPLVTVIIDSMPA